MNQILHVTLFHHHSSSFAILIWTGFTKVGVFWQTWKAVQINIAIFRESSRTMVVTSCQFPPYLTKIRKFAGQFIRAAISPTTDMTIGPNPGDIILQFFLALSLYERNAFHVRSNVTLLQSEANHWLIAITDSLDAYKATAPVHMWSCCWLII